MVQPFNTTSSPEVGSGQPSAPPLENVFPNSAGNEYVDFLVCQSGPGTLVRAERHAIVAESGELKRIINDSSNYVTQRNGSYFLICDTDKDNFELMIRFLETKFIKFCDARHALQMLEIGLKFNCPELIIICAKDLDSSLSTETVIAVFRTLWYHCSHRSMRPNGTTETDSDRRPNSKSSKNKNKMPVFVSHDDFSTALFNNCLQYIDMHADNLLSGDDLLTLRFEQVEMIVRREALQMHSEAVLNDLLARWSREECYRKKLSLTSENRRRVLGALCYTPRYLTMTSADFDACCSLVELLDPCESKLVREELNNKRTGALAPEQTTMLENFRRARPSCARLPIYMTERSNPKRFPRKMRAASEHGGQEGCCSGMFFSCLSVFACIFD